MRPEIRPGGALGALLVLLGSVLPNAAAAERWYRIELVVFAHPAFFETLGDDAPFVQVPALYDVVDLGLPEADEQADSAADRKEVVSTGETPQPAAASSDGAAATDDASEGVNGEADGGHEPPFPAFTVLPDEVLELGPIRDRLEAARGYEPVLHTAWIQPAFGAAARKVRITDRPVSLPAADVADEPEPLPTSEDLTIFSTDGFARLRVGRTLNLDLDLYYQTETAAIRLSESRRVRFRELHYFDHPGFGAVVKVLPVEFGPDSDSAAEGDGA